MSKILSSDFGGEKYGLFFRLVNEDDADFIVKVRTTPQVGLFLHQTSSNIEDQKKWIKDYKNRESKGLDYYFIFFKENKPIGLSRIYNIKGNTFTSGSWAMLPGVSMELVLAVPLIMREIAFEKLCFDYEDDFDGVHVNNKKVLKFNKMFGCKEGCKYQTEQGEFITISLSKEDFELNKPRLIKMLNIKEDE